MPEQRFDLFLPNTNIIDGQLMDIFIQSTDNEVNKFMKIVN